MNLLGINNNTSLSELQNLYAVLNSGAIVLEKIGESDYGHLEFKVNPDYGNEIESYMNYTTEEGELVQDYSDWQFYNNIKGDM